MFGYDAASIVDVTLMELTSPESRALVTDQLQRATAVPYEAVGLRRDATTFDEEIRGTTLAHQG